jgi:hypothetical protein
MPVSGRKRAGFDEAPFAGWARRAAILRQSAGESVRA